MLKKLMPIVLLLVGTGAGVGAGIFMRPVPVETAEGSEASATSDKAHKDGDDHDTKGKDDHNKKAGKSDDGHGDDHGDGYGDDAGGMEYVKLNNQFVVPIVKEQDVASLVVLSLSLEVPTGSKDDVYRREPKIRDSMLQVLFDHANIGGFDGAFTEAKMLNVLRSALREVAQRDLGSDVVNDVLILEIARQDY